MAVSPTQFTKTCSVVLLINHGSSSGALDQILGQISLTFKVVVQALPPIAIPHCAFHRNHVLHRVSDMKVTIIEKLFNPDQAFRKEREKYYIMKMSTKYKGRTFFLV